MSVIRYFQQLFAYDDWANREILSAIEDVTNPTPRSMKLFAHVLSAGRLWSERLQRKPQTYPVWPDFTVEQCRREVDELHGIWTSYLSAHTEEDLSGKIEYKNTKGESWTSRRADILQHVIIHAAHHRGQIVADLRASGTTPPYIDFIHGVRQGLIE